MKIGSNPVVRARTAIPLAFCLAGGVAVSYGVAWAIEYRASSRWWTQEGHAISPPDGVRWPLPPSEWPGSPAPTVPERASTLTVIDDAPGRTIFTASDADRGLNLWSVQEVRVGWPVACCRRFVVECWPAAGQPRSPALADLRPWFAGVHVADVASPDGPIDLPVLLPIKPVWTGLAVDAGVYGGAMLGLWWSAGALRRWVRRRRGLCGHCAYPRGAGGVCPECGRGSERA